MKFRETNQFTDQIEKIQSKEGEFSELDRRKEAIGEIKKKIVRQQVGLGLFVDSVYSEIHWKENFNRQDLQAIFKKFSAEYEFSDEQKAQVELALEGLLNMHSRVEDIKSKYENDPEGLYKECFGQSAKDKVEVVYGPITITYILSSPDFEYCYVNSFKEEEREKARGVTENAQAASLHFRDNYKFAGIVNIAKDSLYEYRHGAMEHEEQHQLNNLFVPQEGRGESLQDYLDYLVEKKMEKKARGEKTVFALAKEIRKQKVDSQARNEILAHLKGGKSPADTYTSLTEAESYQYFSSGDIDRISENLKILFDKMSKSKGSGDRHLAKSGEQPTYIFSKSSLGNLSFDEIKAQVELSYDGYFKTMRSALDAVKDLFDAGLSYRDTVPLLYSLPLDKWAIFIRRFLESKPKDLPGEASKQRWYSGFVKYSRMPDNLKLDFKKINRGQYTK